MTITQTKEVKTSQLPAQTAADVAARLEPLEAELAGLPAKIEAMNRATLDEIASQNLEDCFAISEQLKVRQKTLRVQVWHLKQEKLRLEVREASALQASLASEIAGAAAEVENCEVAVKQAAIKLAAAGRRLATVKEQHSGAIRNKSDSEAALLRLQREKPII